MTERQKKPLPSVSDTKFRARTGRQPMESTLTLPVKPQPHRFRVSVPVADEAVVAWMELQDSQSLSVRMLIRESIERLGYVDVVNKPVAQLPKRGRPAGLGEDEPQQGPEENPGARAVAVAAQFPPVPEVQPPTGTGRLDLSGPDEDAEPELLGIALKVPALKQAPESEHEQDELREAAPVPVPAPSAPEPEPSSDGQVEVDDIFRTLR